MGATARLVQPGGRGAGRLTSIAVMRSTVAATTSSNVAERRIDAAADSDPSVGRWRLQFHAPSPNTSATIHSLAMSAYPYGVDHKFANT